MEESVKEKMVLLLFAVSKKNLFVPGKNEGVVLIDDEVCKVLLSAEICESWEQSQEE